MIQVKASAIANAIQAAIVVTPTNNRDREWMRALAKDILTDVFGKAVLHNEGTWLSEQADVMKNSEYWMYKISFSATHPETLNQELITILFLFSDGVRGYKLEGYTLMSKSKGSKNYIKPIRNNKDLKKQLEADVKSFVGFQVKDHTALDDKSHDIRDMISRAAADMDDLCAGVLCTSGSFGSISTARYEVNKKESDYLGRDGFGSSPEQKEFLKNAVIELMKGKPVKFTVVLESNNSIFNTTMLDKAQVNSKRQVLNKHYNVDIDVLKVDVKGNGAKVIITQRINP